jgi:NAD(P)-dependent dehydrogenase (short-subunit alcohol dehydrogenase family)
MSVDLLGTFLINKYIGAAMTEAGRGAIVNIGSMAYAAPVRLHAYGPAKAGVAALTRQLAMEWGRRGVRVNAIAPGNVLTQRLQSMLDQGERDPLGWRNRLTARGYMVAPREIAAAAWFLLSDDASAVTGQVLHVDAGQSVSGFWLLSVAEQALDVREQST